MEPAVDLAVSRQRNELYALGMAAFALAVLFTLAAGAYIARLPSLPEDDWRSHPVVGSASTSTGAPDEPSGSLDFYIEAHREARDAVVDLHTSCR